MTAASPSRRRILAPLPDHDFDPTETAIPWHALTQAGHTVVFASESGQGAPRADPVTLGGPIPKGLRVSPEALERYRELERDAAFQQPLRWQDIEPDAYDALLLPGGHAPGMRPYLESPVLQGKLAAFWASKRPVGAICHGVLALARIKGADGRSVLHERRTTALTKLMEWGAYAMTFLRVGKHYRTYDVYLEDEVRSLLGAPSQFDRGPLVLSGTPRPEAGFVVEDGNYLSARFPGDAWVFARRFLEKVNASPASARGGG
ncbi:type 1 glutamine amidotransferase domain-containing protein [Hyalangium versicolor]|uniref:type 1 glutamine amidotransferase domain-containing protein n=1 Tax=Hyalangium versicolor TaxID=2861190 RepID=UPI001CCE3E1B|nr:type 1 glutamine amidotransferase domain-containing protein [Hyalangium versicolor]